MPIEITENSLVRYFLIAFDAEGNQRTNDPDGPIAAQVESIVKTEPITDVFILSHGWQGDLPAARQQYQRWIAAMAQCPKDITRLKNRKIGYHPLIVGLHWPSLPWGNEELSMDSNVSFSSPRGDLVANLVTHYTRCLSNTSAAREALKIIFNAARENITPDTFPDEVRLAYLSLNNAASLGSEGLGSAPGEDREPFDPEGIYNASQLTNATFGDAALGGLLAPLRALSFWKMKDRACRFGESGALRLVRSLQDHCTKEHRFHLIGHSFGCIVASAIVAGTRDESLPRPIHSLSLIQGALSLWSFCADIPYAKGQAGYFHSIVKDQKVSGPIITTISAKDTAVGRFYPLGAGMRGDIAFAPVALPKYGGIGSYGARGPGLHITDLEMGPVDTDYPLKAGGIYNMESTRYIAKGGGISGGHSDIAHPEIAHACWAAVNCVE